MTPGVSGPKVSKKEFNTRKAILWDTVHKYLPEFVESVRLVAEGEAKFVALHQDAFAAAYDDDEYMLLGMAIKYAGLKGANVMILGDCKDFEGE